MIISIFTQNKAFIYTMMGSTAVFGYLVYFMSTYQFMLELAKVDLLQHFRKSFGIIMGLTPVG
jgi:hypothetical protein